MKKKLSLIQAIIVPLRHQMYSYNHDTVHHDWDISTLSPVYRNKILNSIFILKKQL